jgi:hypothetical protein
MYKLTKKEENNLNEFNKFIEIFYKDINFNKINNKKIFGPYDYRKLIIKRIKENYTIEEFYFYEKMLNKILWNMLEKENYKTNYKIIKNKNELKNIPKLMERSFINKIIIKDYKNNKIYYNENYILLKNNKIINKIIKKIIGKNHYSKYYYPYDYPFPNINFAFYNNNSKNKKIENIKKYYYSNNDKYWYKPNII